MSGLATTINMSYGMLDPNEDISDLDYTLVDQECDSPSLQPSSGPRSEREEESHVTAEISEPIPVVSVVFPSAEGPSQN